MFERYKSNWILVCAALLGVVFASEWAVRLLAPQTILPALISHKAGGENQGIPFGRTVITQPSSKRFEIRLNSNGFRMQQELSQSRERSRILVYGGSALFAAHLPIEESIFGQLKTMIEKENHEFQLVNTAVEGHGLRQTRLLMKQQIPKFRPAAVIYILDANHFSHTLVAGTHSEMSRLRYDQNGRPRLSTIHQSDEPKYPDTIQIAANWLYRKSHLITLITKLFNQGLKLVKQNLRDGIVEIQIAELPLLAQENPEVQEFLYLSELSFQNMAKIAKAADIPLLVLWLPAQVELLAINNVSPVTQILGSHRQMLRTLAKNREYFEFWDNFHQMDENISTDLFFQSKEFNSDVLSVAGSHWFAKKSAPIIKKFLLATQ